MVTNHCKDALSAALARKRAAVAAQVAPLDANQLLLWNKQSRQHQVRQAQKVVEGAETPTPRRRRRQSLRLQQQRRAAHARARWPWKLQTQYLFTDAEACLVDTLVYLGSEQGLKFDAYRTELENRANIKPSTQRAAEAKLRALGLIEVIENRRGYARSEANTYRLKGAMVEAARIMALRRGGAPVAQHGGTQAAANHPRRQDGAAPQPIRQGEGAKYKHPFGGVENLSPHTSRTLGEVERTPSRRPPVARRAPTSPRSGEVCMSLGRNEGAGSPCPPAPSAGAAEIRASIGEVQALDLARSFLPELAPSEPPPENAAELMELADRLRLTYAPTVYPPVWRTWRKRHGLIAALAVIETGLMRQGGRIRESGGQYLAGILGRNRRQAPAPEVTLQAIRAARRSPGLTSPQRRAPRKRRGGEGGYD